MTPKQLVSRGFLWLNVPIIILLVGIPIASYYYSGGKALVVWWIFGSIVGGVTLAWLYWSIMASRWQLWAFSKVMNKHELYDRAVRLFLIYPRGHFFEKTMIGSSSQKKKISSIIESLNVPDQVPERVNAQVLKLSTRYVWFSAVSMLFTILVPIGLGIFALLSFKSDDLFFWLGGIIAVGVIIALFVEVPFIGKIEWKPVFEKFKRHYNGARLIELTEEGMTIDFQNIGFVEWEEIYFAKIKRNDFSTNDSFRKLFIKFNTLKNNLEEVEIDLEGVAVDVYEFSRILNWKVLKQSTTEY